MTEAAKEARREYIRQWRKRNPDKMRRYAEAHWERKAQQTKETTTEETRGTDAKNDCRNVGPGCK